MVTLLSGFYRAVTAHSSNEVWLLGNLLMKTLWIQRWRSLTSSLLVRLLVFPFVRSSRMQQQIRTPQDLNGTPFNGTARKAYQLDVAMHCEFISILTNKHLEKTKYASHSSSLSPFLYSICSINIVLSLIPSATPITASRSSNTAANRHSIHVAATVVIISGCKRITV